MQDIIGIHSRNN